MYWDCTFAIFWRDIEASASVGFFGPFPQKSVTLNFECTVAKALGEFRMWCRSFGGHAFPWLFSLEMRHPRLRALGCRNSRLIWWFLRRFECSTTWAYFESGPARPFVILDPFNPAAGIPGADFSPLLYIARGGVTCFYYWLLSLPFLLRCSHMLYSLPSFACMRICVWLKPHLFSR
jgi:hypothetical protein